jgi:hypothetical protein
MCGLAVVHYDAFGSVPSGFGGWGRYNAIDHSIMSAESAETTQLLRAWASGDVAALDLLTPRVYEELRRIAGHFMQNELPDQSMQATALVHEAYLRLVQIDKVDWQHRAHFFAVSAQIMGEFCSIGLAGKPP